MQRYIRLENNEVVESILEEREGFIPCPEGVRCGMILENGEYVKPPVNPEAEAALERELGILILQRKKLEEEYDRLSKVEKDKLHGRK